MPIHPEQINMGELKVRTLFNCPAGIAVGDPVYQDASGHVDLADCRYVSKMPCIGIVDSKPSATTCYVVSQGSVKKSGWGLSPNLTYWIGPGTGIALFAAVPTVPGTVLQEIGYAKSSTEFIVLADRDFTVL